MTSKKIYQLIMALGLLAIVVLMFFWLKPDANWEGVKVISGQTDRVRLPDGSMAYLKGPAQIGYPPNFEEKLRKVKMEGEVSFNVVNNGKSFLVQTEKGGVETHGAKFLVNSSGKKNITVHCLEGQVRMIARGKKEILEIDMESGEMSSFTKGDGVMRKEVIDTNVFKSGQYFTNSYD